MRNLPLLISLVFAFLVAAADPTPLFDLQRDQGMLLSVVGGEPLHWKRDEMPIMVIVHPDAGDWLVPTAQAATLWNMRLGFDAFIVSRELHVEARAYEKISPGVVPILRLACGPLRKCNPATDPRHLADGTILAAPIYAPLDVELSSTERCWVMVHELGHALGLRHDKQHVDPERPYSVMEPLLDGTAVTIPPITEHDLALVRSYYAPKR